MELSAAPEALMPVRAARDKLRGKSEGKGVHAVSVQGNKELKWRTHGSAPSAIQ